MSKFEVPEKVIYMCMGSKCSKRGSKEYYKELKHFLKKNGLKNRIEIIQTECTDRCKFAPVLSAQPANVWLKEYTERELREMVEGMIREH